MFAFHIKSNGQFCTYACYLLLQPHFVQGLPLPNHMSISPRPKFEHCDTSFPMHFSQQTLEHFLQATPLLTPKKLFIPGPNPSCTGFYERIILPAIEAPVINNFAIRKINNYK